jgi:sugar-specific transcriptional regulator TrmB
MTNLEEIEKKLSDLGLSKNQIQIYLLLVQHGELRIQEIANITHIPRSSVYECLTVLHEHGLIEQIVDHKFIRISPYPVSSIRHELNEKLQQLQTQLTTLEDIEKSLTLLPKTNSLTTTVVRYYKDVSGARQLFWNTLKAQSTVYVYSAFGRSKFVGKRFYMDFVKESQFRNIQEQVLINPTERALSLIQRDTGTALARTDPKNIRFLDYENLHIKGETFIYDNIFAQVYLDTEGINGFEIESPDFVESQHSIFQTLWQTAKPLAELPFKLHPTAH